MSNPFDFRMIHFIDQPVVECIFEITKQNSTKEIETNKTGNKELFSKH